MPNFTPEDLIRYLYKETSPLETDAIRADLDSDWTLREKMAVLSRSYHQLNGALESPRTEVVLNLLRRLQVAEA